MLELKLKQAPVITHELKQIGQSVAQRIAVLNLENQIATSDTIQFMKELRAELNKEYTELETQRKTLKKAVLSPYDEFELEYKTEVTERYVPAVGLLKDKIAEYEIKIKDEKKQNVLFYFNELCLVEGIDFVKFESVIPELTLSTTETAYKKQCKEFIAKTVDELNLIDTQPHKAEILVEYKKTLNAAKAIKDIQDRKEAERQEKERIKIVETQRRSKELVNRSLVFRDITKSYNYISDDSIYILNSEVEELSKDDFNKKIVEIENKIEQYKKSMIKPVEPEIPKLGELYNKMSSSATQPTEEIKTVVEPLKAPTIEQPKEPIFPAKFECWGTMSQLTELGQYMKQNNITFKNL